MNRTQLWWGYIHINGSIQVKPYFSPLDIQDALESPFCAKVFKPFACSGREEAIEHIRKEVEAQAGQSLLEKADNIIKEYER